MGQKIESRWRVVADKYASGKSEAAVTTTSNIPPNLNNDADLRLDVVDAVKKLADLYKMLSLRQTSENANNKTAYNLLSKGLDQLRVIDRPVVSVEEAPAPTLAKPPVR